MLAAIQSRNQYGAIAQKLATYSKMQIAKSCRVTMSVSKSIHPAASAIVIANCQIPDVHANVKFCRLAHSLQLKRRLLRALVHQPEQFLCSLEY